MKYILRIFILISISTSIFIFSSSFPFNSSDIKLVYAKTESRGVPRKGESMGIRIILYFDGTIEKYSIHIRMEDRLIAINHITQNEINNIDKLFAQYDFLSYPEKIPFRKRIMWPSSTTGVKYSPNENSNLKSFVYSSNSDHKYMPAGSNDFIRELRTKLFSYFD
ncbi:MAG: hypothetical protein KJN64_04410 [Ignavibacteria bacterium]|nr:hypothetical protein [Ignavibacteria bacterium]